MKRKEVKLMFYDMDFTLIEKFKHESYKQLCKDKYTQFPTTLNGALPLGVVYLSTT